MHTSSFCFILIFYRSHSSLLLLLMHILTSCVFLFPLSIFVCSFSLSLPLPFQLILCHLPVILDFHDPESWASLDLELGHLHVYFSCCVSVLELQFKPVQLVGFHTCSASYNIFYGLHLWGGPTSLWHPFIASSCPGVSIFDCYRKV